MKWEFSAGGVIYRKINNTVELLLIKDKNNNWTFPKGLIEKREDKIKTAQREIEEEVGLKNIKHESDLDAIEYFYRLEGELIKKRVYYYLFLFTGKEKPVPQKEEGIREARWFKAEEALRIIGYRKTNEQILTKALEKINS